MEYIPRNTFDGIFGEGFSAASPYLYYMVQGIPSILIGTFVYTLFGCVIALYCKKSYQALLWMLGYFGVRRFYWNFPVHILNSRQDLHGLSENLNRHFCTDFTAMYIIIQR